MAVILEFADPTASPIVSPRVDLKATFPPKSRRSLASEPSTNVVPSLSRAASWSEVLQTEGSSTSRLAPAIMDAGGDKQTRLQATIQDIKRMGTGLVSPRPDYSANKQKIGDESYLDYFGAVVNDG